MSRTFSTKKGIGGELEVLLLAGLDVEYQSSMFGTLLVEQRTVAPELAGPVSATQTTAVFRATGASPWADGDVMCCITLDWLNTVQRHWTVDFDNRHPYGPITEPCARSWYGGTK